MHCSWRRAPSVTWKPTAWILRSTPPREICRATAHGSGGLQLSPPSETSTTVFCFALPRSSAAPRSDAPIGVKPRGCRPAICSFRRARSSSATGATSFVSAQPARRPVPLTSEP
jgi:hypothetical protein